MKRLRYLTLSLVLLTTLIGARPAQAGSLPPLRRVHAPYFADGVRWAESGLFWFGRVDPPSAPGRNYVDVRVAYTADALHVYLNVEDYHIWYKSGASAGTDLTLYDAAAIYLDTHHDRAGVPQADDYRFLRGLCLYGCGDGGNYHRQARGTGNGWTEVNPDGWTASTWAQWGGCSNCAAGTCGPNSAGTCGMNFGWYVKFEIPWSTLGLSGPPARGTVWGLGVMLYDRDGDPPAGDVPVERWPETFDADDPSTWGELAFGPATYAPPQPLRPRGTTVIRRGLGGSTVEDAWVGGGGTCSGGHEGDPDRDNHGSDSSLFVENQEWIADFPCFSKSYLRFYLDPIPPGKEIVSATLTIHHWSNARWDKAQPSLIWVFTVDGDWGEHTLTWNNAPLARENLTAVWVDVITPENNPGLPGNPYSWDVTQAVAEAYAAGVPLNLALYTADVNQHSSKYLISSESAPVYADARPTLTVVWGDPLATVEKEVRPTTPPAGGIVTYTVHLLGSGYPLTLTDDLPPEIAYTGFLQVTGEGEASYDDQNRRLVWTGTPTVGEPVTLTYSAQVLISDPTAVWNTATLSGPEGMESEDVAVFIVDGYSVHLPLVMRAGY